MIYSSNNNECAVLVISDVGQALFSNDLVRCYFGNLTDGWENFAFEELAKKVCEPDKFIAGVFRSLTSDNFQQVDNDIFALQSGLKLQQTCIPLKGFGRCDEWVWIFAWRPFIQASPIGSSEYDRDLLMKISHRVPGVIFKFRIDNKGHSSFPYISDAVREMYPGITPELIRDDAKSFFAFRHPEDAAGLISSMQDSENNLSSLPNPTNPHEH